MEIYDAKGRNVGLQSHVVPTDLSEVSEKEHSYYAGKIPKEHNLRDISWNKSRKNLTQPGIKKYRKL